MQTFAALQKNDLEDRGDARDGAALVVEEPLGDVDGCTELRHSGGEGSGPRLTHYIFHHLPSAMFVWAGRSRPLQERR
jgi:hypothetical protein